MGTENYDPCYPDQPVVDRYLPVWAKLPAFAAKPAFIWADDDATSSRTALTYSQLDSAVERMARNLLGTLRRGDAVLVLASPGLRLVKLLFACQRAGLTAAPVIPPDPARFGPAHAHLLRAVSQTRPSAAVADAHYIDAVTRTAAGIAGGDSGRLAAMLRSLRWLAVGELERERGGGGPGSAAGYVGCGPDDVYLIQYTSGATGVPKPVMVTAGSAAHNVRAARKAYDLCPGSVVVSWLPQYHDCGLMFLLLTVVAGATCVLAAPGAFVRRPRLWLELVTEFRATCTPVPSFALPLVLRRGRTAHGRPLELGSLRNLILINEPIYESCVSEFVQAFGRNGLRAASISPSYGLAENCTFVSTAWRGACSDLPSYMKLLPSARLSPPPPSSGNVWPEIEIAVVDEETGEPVEDGVEGEIWVSSPSNASGYLGHPSASREVFCARMPGRAGACFVRTGDRGVVKGAERYLYVVGRSADAIALDAGGQRRVHAHYVETAAFGSAPDRLRGGCVAAFTTSTTPRSLSQTDVAVVEELQKGSGGDHRGLCDRIRAAVWREEGVRVGLVVLVDGGQVPKTTSGKLRRGAAREMLLAGKLRVVFEARFDDGDGSVAGVRGNEGGEMAEASAAGWETDMATAFGSASRRLRLQSFL
ncbi:long-chain-fatty-acid--AMP ligase FadD32-like [Panicum miliaceum]|uniref:Long-chain-fatty-acid--AMP ligase FadD32-like n=1 Tax=Panicum miliaceum TaxID=4540 RepID=A0A3L6T0J0_PANMI|nr:long-chain-fatty-acid--AMP ligase FadD32-like [Panicum miliaceum]